MPHGHWLSVLYGICEWDGITAGELQPLSCVWKDIDFPFGWCVWFNQLQVCVKSSARSRYTQQFKRLLRNTRLQGGVYRGKPINLKDEVNGVQKKCGIDNVPSLVRSLTPGLCIHKGAETFLNCFKREDSSDQHSCFHFSFLSALGCDIVFRDKLGEDPPGHHCLSSNSFLNYSGGGSQTVWDRTAMLANRVGCSSALITPDLCVNILPLV